jgi:diaminopimelate epimerase
MSITYTKMHGLGNDYLYIETEKNECNDWPELSRQMSHRHLGAGSDGIILIMPSEGATDFKMRIFNADGSEAETCGNGIRCFAKYVFEKGLTTKTEFVIDTLGGPNAVVLTVENSEVVFVRSNMGAPKFERAEIPMTGADGRVLEEDIEVGGQTYQVTCANIGNPHAVVFADGASDDELMRLAKTVGPLIEKHPAFTERTNVEFVNVLDRQNIVMRIWERGSGITMASGSGSCGAALASMITERVDRKVKVHLVYGELGIEWSEVDGNVYQEGPATEVYTGVWGS